MTSTSTSKSPSSSLLECIYPLSGKKRDGTGTVVGKEDLDILRSSISDLGPWSSFRLAKFFSDVDALTADVAYRHASACSTGSTSDNKDKDKDGEANNNNNNNNNNKEQPDVAFVTAGHFNSRKLHSTDISKDLILRCYPTNTGTASIEIRTDVIQLDDEEEEKLVNVCFTSMVAVNKKTLRPEKNVIPKLQAPSDQPSLSRSQHLIRAEMSEQHNAIRKQRYAQSMYLTHGPTSSPPTQEEMTAIHSLERKGKSDPNMPHAKDHTYRSSFVVYPEKRNVHGKMFGGFVMEQSHILAQYAADFYLHSNVPTEPDYEHTLPGGVLSRAIPLGLDDAIFWQPVSIGDHVTFIARVVHSTSHSCRVVVLVEVRDPADRHSGPLWSNRISFIFGGRNFPPQIVPDTYTEILMHVEATRREALEGPLPEEVEEILDQVKLLEELQRKRRLQNDEEP